MDDFGRRIRLDMPFESALGELSRAIRDEGLDVIARIDVREQFWHLHRNSPPYVLVEAWSPELAYQALQEDPAAGTILPTTFAVYELPDRTTAVVTKEPLSPSGSEPHWQREAPALAAIAEREGDRVARIFARVERARDSLCCAGHKGD